MPAPVVRPRTLPPDCKIDPAARKATPGGDGLDQAQGIKLQPVGLVGLQLDDLE